MYQTFGDRFTYNNPQLASVADEISTLSDQELLDLSPEFATMVAMTRRHSLLLTSASSWEIYQTITNHSDPQIALILASAKTIDGTFRYGSQAAVKQFMFGPGSTGGAQYLESTRNLFVEGIRRVCCSLTAALLILRYAPAGDLQIQVADSLHKKAIEELDRILALPDSLVNPVAGDNSKSATARFYFSDSAVTLTSPLVGEFYIPDVGGSTNWTQFATYPPGQFDPAQVVAGLSDAINALSLSGQAGRNVVAAPVLSAAGMHYIEFTPRRALLDITADLVSVRFTYSSPELPFSWGVDSSSLRPEKLNSLLLINQRTRFTTTSASPENEQDVGYYLYIKRASGDFPDLVPTVRYRLSSTDEAERVFDLPPSDSPGVRASDFAVALLNNMFEHKADSRLLGSIMRNDPPDSPEPIVALELVAWSVTNPETYLTLDILEFPDDLLLAVGNRNGPFTPFSPLPRSLKVMSIYSRYFGGTGQTDTGGMQSVKPQFIRFARSRMVDELNDASSAATGFFYGY